MHYDPEANIISWEISDTGKIDRVLEFGNFVVHLSPSGKPILIEILDASDFTSKMAKLKQREKEKRLAENI